LQSKVKTESIYVITQIEELREEAVDSFNASNSNTLFSQQEAT